MFYAMKSIIVIVLAIAMVGGASIMISYGAIQAEAAKSGTSILWCYQSGVTGNTCFLNHGDCTKRQDSDSLAASSCHKQRV